MSVTLTPAQLAAISERLTDDTTTVEIRRWPEERAVEVIQFERSRFIEAAKILPGGSVKVLS